MRLELSATSNATFTFTLTSSFSWESLGALGIVADGKLVAVTRIGIRIDSVDSMFPSCVQVTSNFMLRWFV
jgi:hypothetical protein